MPELKARIRAEIFGALHQVGGVGDGTGARPPLSSENLVINEVAAAMLGVRSGSGTSLITAPCSACHLSRTRPPAAHPGVPCLQWIHLHTLRLSPWCGFLGVG